MIPQIPPKSTFPVETFRLIFLLLNERKPNNIPKFRSNQRIFIFLPIFHDTPYSTVLQEIAISGMLSISNNKLVGNSVPMRFSRNQQLLLNCIELAALAADKI